MKLFLTLRERERERERAALTADVWMKRWEVCVNKPKYALFARRYVFVSITTQNS